MAEEIIGLNQLSKKLQNLPDRIANKILAKTITSTLRPVAKDIRKNAPRGKEPSSSSIKYKPLHKNIKIKRLKPKNKYERASKISTGKAFWGFLLEKGTKYIAANPWFKPVFDRNMKNIESTFGKKLGKEIEKEAKK